MFVFGSALSGASRRQSRARTALGRNGCVRASGSFLLPFPSLPLRMPRLDQLNISQAQGGLGSIHLRSAGLGLVCCVRVFGTDPAPVPYLLSLISYLLSLIYYPARDSARRSPSPPMGFGCLWESPAKGYSAAGGAPSFMGKPKTNFLQPHHITNRARAQKGNHYRK